MIWCVYLANSFCFVLCCAPFCAIAKVFRPHLSQEHMGIYIYIYIMSFFCCDYYYNLEDDAMWCQGSVNTTFHIYMYINCCVQNANRRLNMPSNRDASIEYATIKWIALLYSECDVTRCVNVCRVFDVVHVDVCVCVCTREWKMLRILRRCYSLGEILDKHTQPMSASHTGFSAKHFSVLFMNTKWWLSESRCVV